MNWLLLLLIAALASCARMQQAAPGAGSSADGSGTTNTPKLIVTPSSVVAGTASLVNANARYVVVSYPLGVLPEIGCRLNVYRNGLKVGELRISGPQRDVNTVADILAGEVQVGDEVRPD